MKEVRFHSKKGQGALEAGRLLAGAFRLSGRDASWHTPLGWECAVNFEAAVSISEEEHEPSFCALVVFYPPLLEIPDIWIGIEQPDIVLVNTKCKLEAISIPDNIGFAIVDATGIAKSIGVYYGLPCLAAPMLGALSAISGVVLGSTLMHAMKEASQVFGLDENDLAKAMKALEKGYDTAEIIRGRKALHVDDPELERLLWAS